MSQLGQPIPRDTKDIKRIKSVGLERTPKLIAIEPLDGTVTYTPDELRDKFNELLNALQEAK